MLHDVGHPDRYTIAPDAARAIADNPRICLTFDDGYAGIVPFLASIPPDSCSRVVLFPVAGKVGGVNDWDSAGPLAGRHLLSWEQLGDMRDCGVAIGSHGMTHVDLRRLPPEALDRELRLSKRTLEDRLGIEVHGFSYPYGLFTPTTARAVEQAGYRWAVTTDASPWRGRGNPFRIRRVPVHGGEGRLLTMLKTSPLLDLVYLPQLPLLMLQRTFGAAGTR